MTNEHHNTPQPRRGRPRRATAESHTDILDAVYELLQERSVRDLTMEAVAKKAAVGKPTLYKWWPTKAALVMDMLQHRFGDGPELTAAETGEATIRQIVGWVISAFNGPFGKVLAELIAEGQSDSAVLQELYDRHIRGWRTATVAYIEQDKASGALIADADPDLVIDAIFGAIYYRLLLRSAPLTEQFGNQIVDQVLRGVRGDV
jgi:AcrR family transcriptional regulator